MHRTYVRDILQCVVLDVHHKDSELSVSGTSEVGMNINSVGFWIKFHLVKFIVGVNANDSGEISFREEGPTVVYRRDTHVGVRGMVLRYITNR